MKKIKLSDHFTTGRILLFSLPGIGMQLVDNTYQIVDGYFISNYIGKKAFAAENMIFPPILLLMSVGMMFGSGASALVSYSLGEGDKEKANRQLTITVAALLAVGVIISALMYLLLPGVASLAGASDDMIPSCVRYGRILTLMMPFQILNFAFHPLFIAADRPGLGLAISVINATINIFLDWVMVAAFSMGLTGAALATGLSWIVSALVGIAFFIHKGDHLHFMPVQDVKERLGDLPGMCYNGASEMVDVISYAIVAILFNLRLIRYIGENGVAAYAVAGYVSGIFIAFFSGISMSITPIVGYHFGNDNKTELKSVRKNGIMLMGGLGFIMTLTGILFAGRIGLIFVGYDSALLALSIEALRIISLSCVFAGITSFASAFFTGMENAASSLLVSVSRSFVFPLAGLLLLPGLFGRNGIWAVTPLSEVMAMAVAIFLFAKYKRTGF